jgi:hypothetical protein
VATLVRKKDRHPYILGPEQLVGRSTECGLRLEELAVSSVHAQLRWSGRGWELRDLGSRNGTFVDGSPLGAGQVRVLRDGATVVFGHGGEAWELADAGEPAVRVVVVDDGTSLPLVDQIIAIPSATEPVACVFQSGEQWLLEQDGERRPLKHNELFQCGGRLLRFECPHSLSYTPLALDRPCALASIGLSFEVSQDEEHVSLSLDCPGGLRRLPQRACHYLALVLARVRQRDAERGAPDPGWLDVDALLTMIPEYQTAIHVNVDVYRLRRLLAAANLVDPDGVVERQPGRLRIGVDRIKVERMG